MAATVIQKPLKLRITFLNYIAFGAERIRTYTKTCPEFVARNLLSDAQPPKHSPWHSICMSCPLPECSLARIYMCVWNHKCNVFLIKLKLLQRYTYYIEFAAQRCRNGQAKANSETFATTSFSDVYIFIYVYCSREKYIRSLYVTDKAERRIDPITSIAAVADSIMADGDA